MATTDYSKRLFIGGISWETDESRLCEYFSRFGQVTEAIVMRDPSTGRARGFGFVVFADTSVVERVMMGKHMIDGRLVKAKKAVPRADHRIMRKRNASNMGQPGTGCTRKIFVGGLPSDVTEVEFRRCFEQFGVIIDVTVIQDHDTHRSRGFGFITYDSKEAVDKALCKSFHELKGKTVEVKRAIPKLQYPSGPVARSPVGVGQNYAVNHFLNGFNQGYNLNPMVGYGPYGMRVDGRYGLLSVAQNGFSSFGPGFGMPMNNVHGGMTGIFGANSGFVNSSNGRQMGNYNGSSNSSILGSPFGYFGLNGDFGSMLSSLSRNAWGNGSLNYPSNPTNMNAFASPGIGGQVSITGDNWGGLPSAHGVDNISALGSENLDHVAGDNNNSGLPSGSYGRSNSAGTIGEPFSAPGNTNEVNNPDTYGRSSISGGTAWRFASSEVEMPSFCHDLGNIDQNIKSDISASYMGNYTGSNNQPTRGTDETPILSSIQEHGSESVPA